MRPPLAPLATPAENPVAVVPLDLRTRMADARDLLKPGISAFLVVTAAAGYLLGATEGVDWFRLAGLLLGTALTAGGAGALNHLAERGPDGRMDRTRNRPLPSGRIAAPTVFAYGLLFVLAGLAALALTTDTLTTALAAATVVLYVLVYTPMKRWTWVNTLVGTLPGALPILGGYAAASGGVDAAGWAAFAILVLWQLPHFYALAWMYRDDYARGGFVMLPGTEGGERRTARLVLVASLALLLAGIAPAALGVAGPVYLFGMALLGMAFTLPAFSFFAEPNHDRARRLLLASIAYVPGFFALVLLDFVLR